MSEYHKTPAQLFIEQTKAERISYAEIAELQSLPMTEEEETRRGQIIADGLYLRADRAPDSRGDQRYLTQWGSKTALGLYRTMKRAVLEGDL